MPGTPMGASAKLVLHDDPLGNRMLTLQQEGADSQAVAVEVSEGQRQHLEWLASSAASFHRMPLEGSEEFVGWSAEVALLKQQQLARSFENEVKAEMRSAGLDPDDEGNTAAELAHRIAQRLATAATA